MTAGRALALALAVCLPALTGCFVHTRRVPLAKMPTTVLSATPEQLVARINQRCNDLQSLSAQVTFQATEGGALKGKEKTYTSFSGYILLRKPEDIRVIGFLPVIHTQAFDMASDGKTFKIVIPPKNKAIEGQNTVTKESQNPLENLRPNIFFDSLLIQCISPNDLLALTSNTRTQLDAKAKRLIVQPDYDLTLLQRASGTSDVLIPSRVIHFNRLDLQPYEEDIYDAHGSIETQAIFGPRKTFDRQMFPSTILIRRPLQEYQILITFEKVTFNLSLTNDQFQVKIPPGMSVQHLD